MAGRALGTNHGKSRRYIVKNCFHSVISDTSGDAIVEAAILFPIMIMIFAALVLLAIYLPAQAVLQRATQYAATAIATENSDTWLFFDEGAMSYYRQTDKRQLSNVYVDLFTGSGDVQSKGEAIVIELERNSISSKSGELRVESSIEDMIFYKEIVVTAVREYAIPVNLTFIGFPESISVTATSTVVVQNADEFIRSVDIASNFLDFIIDKYNLHSIFEAISSFGSKVTGLLGW